ncbi:MAG TPA: hypothetical protein VHV08_03350, partial [Pirellulales bacterium]|nr:hypothetical protein [Pirellulales bacterium]
MHIPFELAPLNKFRPHAGDTPNLAFSPTMTLPGRRHAWRCFGIAVAAWLVAGGVAVAAPRISNLSLRGLRTGATTTLVVEGSELLPEPRVWFSAPVARQTIKEGATAARLEIEFTLDPQVASGIYLLRMASASGISEPIALAVDGLPQSVFAPQLAALDVALSGSLEGSTVLSTTFTGKQGQRVWIEAESRRLGAMLNPVVHLYDARRVQLAWSPAVASIAGDSRCDATLPADGQYTVEIHDSLYRGASPGFFRLKIGEFRYADLVFPLAVERGSAATFEFVATNLPADARSSASWAGL